MDSLVTKQLWSHVGGDAFDRLKSSFPLAKKFCARLWFGLKFIRGVIRQNVDICRNFENNFCLSLKHLNATKCIII